MVARIEIAWFDAREQAAKAESDAIRDEDPKYNKARPDECGVFSIGTGRPVWAPETDEHRRLVAEAIASVEAWKRIEDAMFATFDAARQAGVKMPYLFDQIDDGPSRATIYRRIGRSPQRKPDTSVAVSLQPESETAA